MSQERTDETDIVDSSPGGIPDGIPDDWPTGIPEAIQAENVKEKEIKSDTLHNEQDG
jgi:hypothetical protein